MVTLRPFRINITRYRYLCGDCDDLGASVHGDKLGRRDSSRVSVHLVYDMNLSSTHPLCLT
jgi:hypothetical protein